MKVKNIIETFYLVQVNPMPIRESNILDLLFTNDMAFFTDIKVYKTSMSDNNIIETTITYPLDLKKNNIAYKRMMKPK